METATFAGGCFWCTEAIFQNIKGVDKVVSGYAGGDKEKPSYEEVSLGTTHHAEAIQIIFDPKIISYQNLLKIFFATHDPTSKDRQGPDVGTQYRSLIFYHGVKQKKEAEEAKMKARKLYDSPIVSEIVPFKNFYKAEDYHQKYYDKNPDKIYCRIEISPKIAKLRKNFKNLLK